MVASGQSVVAGLYKPETPLFGSSFINMTGFTFEDVLNHVLLDFEIVPAYSIQAVERDNYLAHLRIPLSERDYKGWPSCCSKCAVNSCAKMVYLDLKNKCLLPKLSRSGQPYPIPCLDYYCLTTYDDEDEKAYMGMGYVPYEKSN